MKYLFEADVLSNAEPEYHHAHVQCTWALQLYQKNTLYKEDDQNLHARTQLCLAYSYLKFPDKNKYINNRE